MMTKNIFVGKAIATKQITIRPDRETVHYLYSTKFVVSKSYKGTKSDTVEVLSRINGCSVAFEVDSSYVIFASRHPKYFKQFTTPCQRTAKVSESASLIHKLDKIQEHINTVHLLQPQELYSKIWREELFERVENHPSQRMDYLETQAFIKEHLKPCEIVCEPKNKRDSLIIQSPSFEAAVRKFTVTYEVDVNGYISNPQVEDSWHSIPMKDDAEGCKKNAIDLVKRLQPLNPAEIHHVKVKSTDKFMVDFSLIAER